MITVFSGLLVLLISSNLFAYESCNIYVHGFTSNQTNYFGDLSRQVLWDSTEEIEVSAPEVAAKILKQIETCPTGAAVILRPHSYGAAQVQYILGKGFQFQDLYPEHDFVQVYKKTVEVYAYTGAYHGTPLMDLVCSNKLTAVIGTKLGKSCVKSLTTSYVDNVSAKVTSPGVPTHLIYSSNRSGNLKTTGAIIASHMVGFLSYAKGTRNQNDNTLPTYATRAHANKQLMPYEASNCKKLDSNYFIDFYHTEKFNHNEFLIMSDFMQMAHHE